MIETRCLRLGTQDAITAALEVLEGGGLVAFPTDTVYGLAALATSSAGIDLLYTVKGREAAKAIPILIGSLEQLSLVTTGLTPTARKLAEHFWPGALTLIVPKHPSLPANLTALPTVGIRMPAHPAVLGLIRQSGPLAATSANLSGAQNSMNAVDVLAQLGGKISLVLDGGPTPGLTASTVVDCTGDLPAILREGMIPTSEIEAALANG